MHIMYTSKYKMQGSTCMCTATYTAAFLFCLERRVREGILKLLCQQTMIAPLVASRANGMNLHAGNCCANQLSGRISCRWNGPVSMQAGLFVTARVGTGLVVARTRDGGWSAPSALGSFGLGWGFQVGGEVRGEGEEGRWEPREGTVVTVVLCRVSTSTYVPSVVSCFSVAVFYFLFA